MPSEKNNNKIRVVLVEDEEVLSNVLQSKLEKEGFEVMVAGDGEVGLDLIKQVKPDVILLDIVMPKMDGFEVLNHLRQSEELSKIPVIVISNSGQPVEINKALSLGVKDYLVKAEFDPQEVIAKIRKQVIGSGPVGSGGSAEKDSQSSGVPGSENPTVSSPAEFTVLLVEDDNFLRDLISQKLRREGFRVIEAVDGEDSVRKMSDNTVHIVLLDLILPGIDGFTVLNKMKTELGLTQVPVIILSNLGQKDDIDKGLRLGATDYLVKAHNTPGEIVNKVKSVLAKSYPNS